MQGDSLESILGHLEDSIAHGGDDMPGIKIQEFVDRNVERVDRIMDDTVADHHDSGSGTYPDSTVRIVAQILYAVVRYVGGILGGTVSGIHGARITVEPLFGSEPHEPASVLHHRGDMAADSVHDLNGCGNVNEHQYEYDGKDRPFRKMHAIWF